MIPHTMKTVYQILTKSEQISIDDWLTLEKKVKKFVSWFTIITYLHENVFYFYLVVPSPIARLLDNHPNFLFKPSKLPSAFFRSSRFTLKTINLKKYSSLFSIIEEKKFKQKKGLKFTQITFYKHFPSHYNISFTYKKNEEYKTESFLSFSTPYSILELDFSSHHFYKIKKQPKFINPYQIKPLLDLDSESAIFEVDLFPYSTQPLFLPVEKLELSNHSLVVGQTGTGKSKLIEIIISQLMRSPDLPYNLVLLDPHLTLVNSLKEKFPTTATTIDFFTSSIPLFPSSTQPQTATELTIMLFKTLLQNQFNPYLQRLLRYVLFTLYATNEASLTNLNKFLTEDDLKEKIIKKIPATYDHLKHFFATEFIKYQTQYYETAFIPIISLLEELEFLPHLQDLKNQELDKIINKTPLLLFSLDKLRLGETNTKLISGLIIQQIFLLAQAHKLQKPTLLIVDEAPLVENEAFATILSQSRKFNLSLMLSYQYLNQTEAKLLESLQANIYNYFVFKTSGEDAKLITNLIDLKLEESSKDKTNEIDNMSTDKLDKLKTQLITSLDPRNLFVRLFCQNKFLPAFKAKTITIS